MTRRNPRPTTRLFSLLLVVAIASSGCASALGPRASVRPVGEREAADIPRSYVEQLPVGRQVEVRLRSGGRFKATYMGVEGDAVRLQRTGRLPVQPQLVPLDDLVVLRLAEHNGSPARAVLVGVLVGAAAFFGLLIGSLAAWSD